MFPLFDRMTDLRNHRFFTPVAVALVLIIGAMLILHAVAPATATSVLVESGSGSHNQLSEFDPFNP